MVHYDLVQHIFAQHINELSLRAKRGNLQEIYNWARCLSMAVEGVLRQFILFTI